MLNQSSLAHNKALSDTLNRQIEEYLAKGGKIHEVAGFKGPTEKAPAPPSFLTIARERSSVAKRIRRMLQTAGYPLSKVASLTGLPEERLNALMDGRVICTQYCVESIAMALQTARLSPIPG